MRKAQATLPKVACSQQAAAPTIPKLCVPQDENDVFSHSWRVSIACLRKCLHKLQDFACRFIIDFRCVVNMLLAPRAECSDRGGGLQTRVTCCSRLLAALVANPEPLPGKLTAMSLTVCASIRSCNVNVMLANMPARWVANMHAH